jgi:hypothetical protein
MAGPSMTAEWNSTWTVRSMYCLLNFVNARYGTPLTTVDYIFLRFALFDGVLDSWEAMSSR